jgi:hypothetical protein
LTTNTIGDERPFTLRLATGPGGQLEGTFAFPYRAGTNQLTPVTGRFGADGAVSVEGSFQELTPDDYRWPVTLHAFVVRELAAGRLAGEGEFSILPDSHGLSDSHAGRYRVSIVQGSRVSDSAATVDITGPWRGLGLVLACDGDDSICDHSRNPGELSYLLMDLRETGGMVAGELQLPDVWEPIPLQGTFDGQTLTLSTDVEVSEYWLLSHSYRTEVARVRVRLTEFTASLDRFNRLQGQLTVHLDRRALEGHPTGRVGRGTLRLQLIDVVPARPG